MISKDILMAGSGTAVKAVWLLVFFAAAARILPTEEFADFSFWITVSAIIGLFIDFGQQTALLTRSAGNSRLSVQYTQRKLGLSYLFAAMAAVVVVTWGLFVGEFDRQIVYPLMAIFAGLSGSLGILYCIPNRAVRDYRADLRVGAAEATATILGLMLILRRDSVTGIDVMMIYCVARTLGAIIAAATSKKGLRKFITPRLPSRSQIVNWAPFFIHLLCGALILNVDLIIGRWSLSVEDYALYQGGMRIVHAGNLILTVVNNVYIPRWSVADRRDGFSTSNRELFRSILVVFGLSVLTLPVLYFAGSSLAILIYGGDFTGLGPVFPYLGLLVGIRMMGAYVGVLLSIRNLQTWRTITSTASLVLLVLLIWPWSGGYEIGYMLAMQIFVHLVMLLGLSIALWARRDKC